MSVLGRLAAPGETGTVQVATSHDGHFLAAADEYSDLVTVFDLARARSNGFTTDAVVTRVSVDPVPVGLAFTLDDRLLLVTSQVSVAPANGPAPGSLNVINVGGPKGGTPWTTRAKVPAGCNPVRVVLDPTGKTAWVTARASNAVLAFDTDRLARDPDHALRAWTSVGPAPVGITTARRGRLLLVANSNRFAAPTAPSTVTVLDARAVLSGRPGLLGEVTTGGFPRDMTTAPDDQTVVVSSFGTGSVDIIETGRVELTPATRGKMHDRE